MAEKNNWQEAREALRKLDELFQQRTRLKNIIGERFGRLLVLERSANRGPSALWKCICDCGETTIAPGTGLRAGSNKSCGCWYKEMIAARVRAKLPAEEISRRNVARVRRNRLANPEMRKKERRRRNDVLPLYYVRSVLASQRGVRSAEIPLHIAEAKMIYWRDYYRPTKAFKKFIEKETQREQENGNARPASAIYRRHDGVRKERRDEG